jgi:hypothetical protein
MIEIAISLAIIGFALVAIIGILPFGMGVQKDNRHETIINQDATILMNALRSGERGLDDLTNYVFAITNYTTQFNRRGVPTTPSPSAFGYTWNVSTYSPPGGFPTPADPQFPITNGLRIIGLLGTPRILPQPDGSYLSNYVVAFVRSISGPASEKFPQTDPAMQQFALTYRLICDVARYGTNYYFPTWTNFADQTISTNEMVARSNYMVVVKNFETNLHDLRLTFRWPLLPNGQSGPNRQVFRTAVSGALIQTNEPGFVGRHCTIYYFEPRTFYKGT